MSDNIKISTIHSLRRLRVSTSSDIVNKNNKYVVVNIDRGRKLPTQIRVSLSDLNDAFKIQYSTEEFLTGDRWINGELIYGKVILFGALPNNTTKNVPHGVPSNYTFVLQPEGLARNTIIGNYLPLSYPTGTARVELLIQGSDIRIVTSDNFQDWTDTHVIVYYIKT